MQNAVPWLADKIERRPIAQLRPYANNARTHSPEQIEQLTEAIKTFGWTIPVLCDEGGEIIAGHGRVLAADALGMNEVPIIVAPPHWTEAMRRAYVLADNKLTLNAGWDADLLARELSELKALADLGELDFDTDVIGFSEEEIKALGLGIKALDAMPSLADGEKGDFEQMTFTLHGAQARDVERAMTVAKRMGSFDGPNQNSNGNAIARVAEMFLARYDVS